MVHRIKFGAFVAPMHKPGINPTLALEQDLQLMQQLDSLGYDEAWIGEHHSAGTELISSPEIFIAAAAERTKHLRFGTGVTSISYHNPLWVAERMVQLDHMTRGRVMLGVGPGSLPTDSAMIGLTPTDTRELLSENLEIIVRLLNGETVNAQTKTHKLIDARLHLRPYSDALEIAVAAMASPTGPRLAGTYGLGLLSIGATMNADGFDALAHHWNVAQERASHFGKTVERRDWRLVSMFHLAETEKQAREQVRYGIEFWFKYFQEVAAFPQMAVSGDTIEKMIDFVTEAKVGVIGTAEQARAHIQRLVDQSGGFGTMLMMMHNWANSADTYRSLEILARDVMPHFQGHAAQTLEAAERARQSREAHAAAQLKAVDHMTQKYASELQAKK
ncbi:LLM class flavin-dependent oxidoreductase [Lampropedia aestuarii]|uniref:LLM class flavin-dependent oxidoreductase n=1 Tax=Lampropedia aestuarii TaxID=2562762 RepID=A0A4V3YWK5_9BURK|nr:LLM class flavin-dependent oxidoreductase [Lampropedia aestuarii]MDH5858613.1 LLM class flavin-dependent oxidoreductase [Lampropedia aestuarii]THJ31652.1 LLM class flavin-dependent oxidoreductase [Lampropedia aestuarii]